MNTNTSFPIRKTPLTQHQKLEKQAQKLVAQTFYGTMLKQMRNSPFKSKMFDGGRGGEAFSEMLDQHLSDHLAGATNNQLVHAIAQKMDHQRPRDAKGFFIHDPYRPHSKDAVKVGAHDQPVHSVVDQVGKIKQDAKKEVRSADPTEKASVHGAGQYQRNVKRRNNESFSLRA